MKENPTTFDEPTVHCKRGTDTPTIYILLGMELHMQRSYMCTLQDFRKNVEKPAHFSKSGAPIIGTVVSKEPFVWHTRSSLDNLDNFL